MNVEIVFFRYYIIKVNWCPSDCVRGNDALSDCVFASDGNSSGFLFLREEYCTTIGVWKQSVVARLLVPRTLRRYTWKLKSNPKANTRKEKSNSVYWVVLSYLWHFVFIVSTRRDCIRFPKGISLLCTHEKQCKQFIYSNCLSTKSFKNARCKKCSSTIGVIEPLVNTTRAWMKKSPSMSIVVFQTWWHTARKQLHVTFFSYIKEIAKDNFSSSVWSKYIYAWYWDLYKTGTRLALPKLL